MDSIKTLLDKQEYALVVKLTENTTELLPLFYRTTALVALGKGEQALECIRKNRSIMEQDLKLLMKIHIELLCVLERFDEAYDELKYYENLPYVSQETEELIRDLPKLIRDEERKSLKVKSYDDEKIFDSLESQDSDEVLMALDIIRNRDVHAYLPKIQNIMVNFPKQSIRSFALLLLVQKKVNVTINFNHMGEVIQINPSLLEPPFVDEGFTELVKKMEAEFKNPSLTENAVQILSSYVLHIYPDKIELDIEPLIEALYQIAIKYLQSKDSKTLEDRCFEKGLSVEQVQELIDSIEDALASF